MALISLVVSLFVISLAAITLVIFRTRWSRITIDPDLAARTSAAVFGKRLLAYLEWVLRPLERGLMALGFTANRITVVSLVLAAAAGICFALGAFGIAGGLILASGIFDAIDGRIARMTNTASPKGAVFDSVIDRYSDGVIFSGLVFYYRSSPWILLILVTLMGAYMVSYSRARIEGLGIRADIGSMQRGERIVLLALAALVSPAFDLLLPTAQPSLHFPVLAALVPMAVSAHITVIRRIGLVQRSQTVSTMTSRSGRRIKNSIGAKPKQPNEL